MILKIERYVRNIGDWWMLDDIRKVSKTLIRMVPFKEDDKRDIDADIFICDFYDSLDDKSQQVHDVIKLICRLSNDNEFCVVFDTSFTLVV